ncbi:dethiobiotin synthase [Terasakiella sp. A23]|uniref:dethiobiotin synthase n=1 Tax=Terasakiella sp. FCG-A23 TaxID=3080561 RepID=UPI0029533A6C|nr:dethiobiotin synthase [Terasakiella sp. A23]MDV7338723.1 dethiobiotin synthase [Terasakiella sp. A23]
MTTYFVTGTDTDVGKTVVSTLLVRQLNAYYWKPVQSGTNDIEDKNEVQRLGGISDDRILPCGYELTEPLSPHEAARIDGVEIDLNKIEKPSVDGDLVIEGAGGVLVPLNDDTMIIDLIEKMDCEAIVVARSGLGTINHTLLTLKALRDRNIAIKGVVLNGPLNEKNKKAIEQFGQVRIVGEIPYIEDGDFKKLEHAIFDL